jgi:hypothetical protein
MALQQKSFQDPSYTGRGAFPLGPVSAGSGGVTTKYVAHAALLLMSLSTYQITLGTSTYTGPNGTATLSGQQINVIIVQNTNTTGTAVTLATTTIGPFVCGGVGLATAALGGGNQFAINTATGTSGQGGVPVLPNSLVYCVSGTDTTAVTNCTIDYQIAPGAPLTI